MPELPEVETIRLQLSRLLVGHTIQAVQVNLRKTLKEGEGKLVGGKVLALRRFGKVLVIDLDNHYSVVIHLKMTGQLIYRGPNLSPKGGLSKKVVGGIPGRHSHVIFNLNRRGKLFFNDYRRFGWVKVVRTDEVKAGSSFIGQLGPEPLKDLTFEMFTNIVTKSSKPIKLLLLDQTKISGVGNIYANETLFMAKLRPMKKAKSLTLSEQKRLYDCMIKVLKLAIKRGGSSDSAYVTPEGGEGTYQEMFLVYNQQGKTCQNHCGEKIEKIKLGGRGTYFCPKCQK